MPLSVQDVMRLNERPIHDELGNFSQVHIPVMHTGSNAYFSTNVPDYLYPQKQDEHDDLLNTFYEKRVQYPNWKEMGYKIEQESPHYNSKDRELRTDLNAQSSVVEDVVYDPNTHTAMVQVGKKWHNFNATPDQLKNFFTAGSLGKEFNRMKKGYGSMSKTMSTERPSLSTVLGGI